MTAIIRLGKEIDTISQMEFTASSLSGSKTDWNGGGSGRVKVLTALDSGRRIVRLEETGELRVGAGRSVPFHNTYRLTWYADYIRLHHERFGSEHAVWLFDLIEDPKHSDGLISQAPHPCGDDRYSARLVLDDEGFSMSWKIEGPRKNEHLHYRYR